MRSFLVVLAMLGGVAPLTAAQVVGQAPAQSIFPGVLDLPLLPGDVAGPCKSPSAYAVCIRDDEMSPFEIGFDDSRLLAYLPLLEARGWRNLSAGKSVRQFRLLADAKEGAATHCLVATQSLDIEVLTPQLMGPKVLRLELDPPGVVCGRPGDPPPPAPPPGEPRLQDHTR